MWPDRVSNPGPLCYESGALPTALGPTTNDEMVLAEIGHDDLHFWVVR